MGLLPLSSLSTLRWDCRRTVYLFYSHSYNTPVQTTARVYTKDKKIFQAAENAASSSFKQADGADNLSCECKSLSIQQLQSSFQVSFKSSKFRIFFTFEPSTLGFSFPMHGSKKVPLGDTDGSGSISASFLPKGRVSGQFVVNDTPESISGEAMFVYGIPPSTATVDRQKLCRRNHRMSVSGIFLISKLLGALRFCFTNSMSPRHRNISLALLQFPVL